MAREVIESNTCDVCGQTPVTAFTISKPGKFAIVDLCDTHAAPFNDAMDRGSTEPRKRAAAPTKRQPSHQFIPVDDE